MRLLKTNQNKIVVPTGNMIKDKNIDYRIICAISILSKTDNNTKSGDNIRYCDLNSFNNNIDNILKITNISRKQMKNKLKKILDADYNEFYLVQEQNNTHFNIPYKKGEFTTIPIDLFETKLLKLSNSELKLFITLYWICMKNGKNTEKQISREYLLESIGLSKKSGATLIKLTNNLESKNLISTKMEFISYTDDILSANTKVQRIKSYKIIC